MTKATTPHHSLVDPMGWTLGFFLCSILLAFLMPKSPRTRFPVVNRYRWDYFQTKAKHEFERRAQELIEAGLKQSAVFDMETNMGPRVVISDKFADAWVTLRANKFYARSLTSVSCVDQPRGIDGLRDHVYGIHSQPHPASSGERNFKATG
ncbi:hypothetical protein LTR66_016941 [Elasticomyces elasticus]|nr:hypothetical protein LTR66_016941 [Elasticomyces elasticus]